MQNPFIKTGLAGVLTALVLGQNTFAQNHADLKIPRSEARETLANALFDNHPTGTYHDYNNWRESTDFWYNQNTGRWVKHESTKCSHSDRGGHPGIDIQTRSKRIGEPFYALDSGVVTEVGGYGVNTIAVYNEYSNRTTLYLHADRASVDVGDTIRRGDQIGEQGDVGSPGAVHVHVEVLAGKQVRPLCGADNPGAPNRISVDPTSYLFSRVGSSPYNYENDKDDDLEKAYRVAASKILPPMIRSSNSRLRCDGDFRIDFEFSSYMSMDNIAVIVGLFDSNRNRILNRVIKEDELRDQGAAGFVVTTDNGLPERAYRVKADVTLDSSQRDQLGDRALVRAYIVNAAVQGTLPDFDEVNWAAGYSLFVPYLLQDNLGEGNSAYTRGEQSFAQRYIEIDTSQCR